MPENFILPSAEFQLTSVEPQLRRVFSAGKYQTDSMVTSSSDTINSCPDFSRLLPTGQNVVLCQTDEKKDDVDTAIEIPRSESDPCLKEPVENEPIDAEMSEKAPKHFCAKSFLGIIFALSSGLANSLVALLVKLIESIGMFWLERSLL